ncbi:hypothetical protein E2C01_090186 [Portunus trituberculatus]|uniref:Uncharacterized protein n=1 Tax=Portunus trituberculatus TaxID=210409 RepID=A0A5B7JRI7_PORTR|nr:hypothetical protein [Portunus trituberculatus]
MISILWFSAALPTARHCTSRHTNQCKDFKKKGSNTDTSLQGRPLLLTCGHLAARNAPSLVVSAVTCVGDPRPTQRRC